MSYFKDIALLKAPLAYDMPQPQYMSDLIEICTLAAVVQKDVNSVRIPVDFYNDTAFEDFERYLKTEVVDLVGISSMTGAFNNAMRLAEMAKRADKFVVMGGYHPSALPREVLESPYVDAVVIGEGEMTFRDLVLNGPSGDVPGIAFKSNGTIVINAERPLIQDLDALPLPLRSARPSRFGEAGDDYSMDMVYTSRGCPRQCSFCANDLVNKRWRARSPEHIVRELTILHDPKRKKYLKLWDANFLTNVKRIEELCDLMLEKGLTNFKICIETGVNDVVRAEAIMHKLRKIGVVHVGLGIESPNEETLKLMNKKISNDTCSRAVQILNEHKIKALGFFIIGHYTETEEDTKKYPEYAESLGLRQAIFMVMTPSPGTQVFNEYRQENKITNYNWDLYNNFGTVVETKHMDTATLKMMHSYCWGKFYVKFAFMSNSRPLGVAGHIFQRMAMFYSFFTLDKTNTVDNVTDYLYEFIDASCGVYTRKKPHKRSLILNFFNEFNIRFVHSQGKAVDLKIYPSGDMLHMSVKRAEQSPAPAGFVIDIYQIIKLGRNMTANRLVGVAGKIEIARCITGNRSTQLKKYLSLALDKNISITAYQIVRTLLPAYVKGMFSFSTRLVKQKIDDIITGAASLN